MPPEESLLRHLASHFFGNQLNRGIAEEEDADAESEHLGGEAQLLVHGERRKPDIDAIQIGDEEAQNQKWNEALRSLTRCTARGPVRDIQVGAYKFHACPQ